MNNIEYVWVYKRFHKRTNNTWFIIVWVSRRFPYTDRDQMVWGFLYWTFLWSEIFFPLVGKKKLFQYNIDVPMSYVRSVTTKGCWLPFLSVVFDDCKLPIFRSFGIKFQNAHAIWIILLFVNQLNIPDGSRYIWCTL